MLEDLDEGLQLGDGIADDLFLHFYDAISLDLEGSRSMGFGTPEPCRTY